MSKTATTQWVALAVLALLALLLKSGAIQAQSPLDEWYENESITNRGKSGNQWNTTMDDYYADDEIGSRQGPDESACAACYTPNPPHFCDFIDCPEDPSVPIDSGVILLILGGLLFGTYKLQKKSFSKV